MTEPWVIHEGNSLDVLAAMPAASVQCAVTSPPYFALRQYAGVEPARWPAVSYTPMAGLPEVDVPEMECCLGLEKTPAAFVAHLVAIFREVFRVLRDDGVFFLNLGDSFNAAGRVGHGTRLGKKQDTNRASKAKEDQCRPSSSCLKPKDLIPISWMTAMALQADGWYLRQCICWSKLSPMPSSVTDRPTTATEYIFFFAKREKYFYDADACRPALTAASVDRGAYPHNSFGKGQFAGSPTDERHQEGKQVTTVADMMNPAGRNLWSWIEVPDDEWEETTVTWKLATESSGTKNHYASYPSAIPRLAIKLGSSQMGCCSSCGSPLARITERSAKKRERPNDLTKRTGETGTGNHCGNTVAGVDVKTLGWEAGCACNADTVPCTILDPFAGSGTSGIVARQLGRRFVGIDASPGYATMARRRLAQAAPIADAAERQLAAAASSAGLFDHLEQPP